MNIYNAFFDLKPGIRDLDFCEHLTVYMENLTSGGQMQGWRLMRGELLGRQG